MAFIRSVLHALLMLVTVIPWGIWMVSASLWSSGEQMYWKAARWLSWQIAGARVLCGIQVRVSGMDNLPQGKTSPAILLVKHQSAWETFTHAGASCRTRWPTCSRRSCIYVPFFGWAMGRHRHDPHRPQPARRRPSTRWCSRASG
jgi:1-acyl-sn-glycerol-3-phosphate acyltransferase